MEEKEPQSTTESTPRELSEIPPPPFFGIYILKLLEERLKVIVQEPISSKRNESALEVLRDIVLDTAVEFIVDDPNEPELPEEKLVMLPFGGFYVSVGKQSHANFFIEHFGATEVDSQRPKAKERHDPSPYIEGYDKVFKGKKGKTFEVHHVLDEKGNIIHTSVQRD